MVLGLSGSRFSVPGWPPIEISKRVTNLEPKILNLEPRTDHGYSSHWEFRTADDELRVFWYRQ
jgi:hypothetical protein